VVATLLLLLVVGRAHAQPTNFDALGDGTDALAEALLATPNNKTPAPDVNLFATALGEEQATTRLGTIRLNALASAPIAPEVSRACRQLSQKAVAARWTAAMKLRAVLS
jgi:hypothetical protein